MSQLDLIRARCEAILHLAKNYGIRRVRLFGSVARGEERPESDIDVLVDFEPGRSLLDQVGFRQDLEELLGRRPDSVVSGRVDAAAAVVAGDVSDEDYILTLWRRIARETELARPSMGVLADRHWPPLQ